MSATLLQKADQEQVASVNTFNKVFGSTVTAGSQLFAWLRIGAGSPASVVVSDNVNAGNWTNAVTISDATNGRSLYLFYKENSLAGTITVTASWLTAAGNDELHLYEYSGLLASGTLDQQISANPTTTTTPTSGSITTTNANDLILGAFILSSSTTTTLSSESTGFATQLSDTLGTASHPHMNSADRIVSATGAFEYKPTLSVTEVVCIAIASFKAKPPSGGWPSRTAGPSWAI